MTTREIAGTAAPPPRRATVDDVLARDGKVELIGGRIVEFPMPGRRPGRAAGKIYKCLDDFAERTGRGDAFGDGVDFKVPELSSGRETFRPDCSYYDGRPPAAPDDALPGPPTFAVEVRSKEDYGPAADRALAAKRAEYFEAGTLVVWDVNPAQRRIAAHRRSDPDNPVVFRAGETAHAEPAVPGWTMGVDEVFA